MNNKFEEYKNEIKNKKIAIIGLGISNRPILKYLANLGINVTGFDRYTYGELKSFVDQFENLDNVNFHLGPNNLEHLSGFDLIIKTPAMRPDIPHFLKEIKKGAILTSEMEIFMNMCQCKMIAVTGSDGKTTTTSLIGEMLKLQGYKAWVGGNIGTPLFDQLDVIEKEDYVVLELGSFQLQTIKTISADIAVVTNMSPNHLDFHGNMEEYIESKQNVYRYQSENDSLIINYDNEITKGFEKDTKSKVTFFSRKVLLEKGVSLIDNKIFYDKEYILDASEIILKGIHNKENFCAAIAAVKDLVDNKTFLQVAKSFSGVEHRIEYVTTIKGIQFYNDSIGSSPTRTCASLRAFDEKVILIAGGYDKKISYNIMGELIIEKVKGLVLLGQTGPKILAAFEEEKKKVNKGHNIKISNVSSLEEAVTKAYEMANKGDIIILSPASSSYDMFPNFEVRGKLYKDLVNSL